MQKCIGRFIDEMNLPELNLELAMEAASVHEAQFGFVPTEWEKIITQLEAKAKYEEVLRKSGFSSEELTEMSLVELRDEINKTEYILTITALPSGGVSRTRLPLKKAA